MSRGEKVAVIGGGVIGALSAWYLAKDGYQVTIVDKDQFGAACSHGNCGYVCPSHALPLSQPGAVKNTLRAMLRPNSPFTIKPRLSPSLWKWLWRFMRHCNQADMMRIATDRNALLQSSMQLYRDLIEGEQIECEWTEKGLLFVYHDQKEFEEYAKVDAMIQSHFGISAVPYDAKRLVELEPALKEGLGGAWHYESDCHIRPDKLMSQMRKRLTDLGVEFIENFSVENFQSDPNTARSIQSGADKVEADIFVVATGALTPFLNKHLGCTIPIQPGKGYSITMPHPEVSPKIPLILESHRVAVTPMRDSYRLGSTMEFSGYDSSINRKRLGLLKSGAEHYLRTPHCDPVEEEWFGWRPMTWDGKPVIDKSPKYGNVWIAAGHNMLGLSMATGTGKLISELISGEQPHLDVAPYSVTRF